MNRIEDLRRVTDNTLHGLIADDSLKFRILQKAAQSGQDSRKRAFRPVPVLCSLIALLVVAVVALSTLKPVAPSNPGEMNVFAAGSKETDAPYTSIDPDTVISVELSGIGTVTDPEQCAELIALLQQDEAVSASGAQEEGSELTVTSGDGTVYRYILSGQADSAFCSLFRQYAGK